MWWSPGYYGESSQIGGVLFLLTPMFSMIYFTNLKFSLNSLRPNLSPHYTMHVTEAFYETIWDFLWLWLWTVD